MSTNILIALINFIKNPVTDIVPYYKSHNRANNAGESLEKYIMDLFCGSFSANKKNEHLIYNKYFSYLANQNNPPDFIIRGGDAIEVKKIESLTSGIALNSSYPKNKLYADSTMITKDCKRCENWEEKDIIYAVGSVNDNNLQALCFVYGTCYAASKEKYEKIKNAIANGLNNNISNIEFSRTKELGRVNKVDPLGITYLRIRGMWGIENPLKVFDYVIDKGDNKFMLNAIMLEEKYLSFPENDRKALETLIDNSEPAEIKDILIKSPNNPADLLKAKIVRYVKK
jgi:hypothetical protein